MITSTAPTTAPASCDAGAAATLAEDRPAYRYAGAGRFQPANAAAWREVDAWNEYATLITARSAVRRSEQ